MKRSERALPFGRALSDKGVKCNGDDALAWRAADAGDVYKRQEQIRALACMRLHNFKFFLCQPAGLGQNMIRYGNLPHIMCDRRHTDKVDFLIL